jgi:hypothetical protein
MRLGRFIGLVFFICGVIAAFVFRYDLEDGNYYTEILFFRFLSLGQGVSFLLFPVSEITFLQVSQSENAS